MADLPLHRRPDTLRRLPVVARQPQQLQPVQQRRERIAQLVPERRQELVLALVERAERLRGALALLEVLANLVLALRARAAPCERALTASRRARDARAA